MKHHNNQQQQQPFHGRLSGTARVGKHPLSTSSIYYDL